MELEIQELLGKEIAQFVLKGKGAVNFAYYVETIDGGEYIVKQGRSDKEFQPQNNLIVEAKVAQTLYNLKLSIPTPHVVFTSENPEMYGYEYIEGDLMIEKWESFSENERRDICYQIGYFHAEIGKKFSRKMAMSVGVKIDLSAGLHSEVLKEYKTLIVADDAPEDYKVLATKAKSIFDTTLDKTVFQFLHNDSHHENIIIRDKKISGIIDFGNAEYGEVAKEFSRFIRDYPDYFEYIVYAYEKESESKLSYERLISNALLSGFAEIVEDYRKGGESKTKAEKTIATYRKLIDTGLFKENSKTKPV